MRGLDRPDEAERALLDDNVRQAEKAYRDAGNFDVATRALSGWREALMQRLDATPAGAIETALVVSLAEGVPMGPPTPVSMAPSHYWDGVPSRLRDAARYTVHRTIALRFGAIRPDVSLKVYEIATNTLAWAHEAPKRRPGWEEEI
jgi:hypothetical protein